MFFYCTLPEIKCSPFTVGREVVLSFSQRRRRGGRTSESGREVKKEKEWLSADSLSTGGKSSLCGSLQEGKQTRSLEIESRKGGRRKEGLQTAFPQAEYWFHTVMAAAASPKRMVSSVFITLTSPHRATVTQQQPVLTAHSDPAADKQHAAIRISPGDHIPALRHRREDRSQSESYSSVDSRGRTCMGGSTRMSDPQSPKSAQPGPSRRKTQEDNRGAEELLPAPPPPPPVDIVRTSFSEESAPPPPPPVGIVRTSLSEGSAPPPPPPVGIVRTSFSEGSAPPPPPPVDIVRTSLSEESAPPPPPPVGVVRTSFSEGSAPPPPPPVDVVRTSFSEGSAPPPPPPVGVVRTSLSEESAPPPPPPAQTPLSLTPGQQPVYNREVEAKTPSNGFKHDEQSHGVHKNGQDTSRESTELCGFCRKPVALSELAIEALNRTYHEGCFQCRSCHIPLAGKQYYNKAGIPLCEDCYQASLELCWACGDAITDHVIRALERAYHLSCFTCATCKQQIGEQAFAQGEVGEVYCLQDYYRKYAPKCHACNQLIIPKEDGTDSYNVQCLGKSYHENCYRCEVCVIQLSPEPNEHGCYPLDGKLLCKLCHLNLVSGQH